MRLLAFFVSLLSVSFPLAAQEAPLLTVDEALDAATRQNRDLAIARLDVGRARDAVSEAKTNRFPVLHTYLLGSQLLTPLDFKVPAGQFGFFPNIGPVPPTKTDIRTPLRPTALAFVSLTQPLTQLRRINRAIRQAQLGTQIASEQLRAKAQQTNDQVRQAYYLILQSQSSLDALQSSVDSYQELDHLTDRYLLEKTVLKPDSLRVKAELAKARYQLVAAQDTLANAKEQLNRLLSRDVTTEFRVAEVATELPEEQSLAEARKEALSHRPEIKQTQLQEQQAALDVQIEKSKYIPDISFRADYLSPINVNFVPENIASVGFVVEWQPFDWGQKKYDLAQKRTVDRQAQIRVEDAKQQILVDVDTAFRRLRETRLMLTVASAARDAESERLRVVMNQYSQKAALLDTVLQEKATLASAEDQYRQTVLGFWKARADFERALGQE